MKIIYNIFLNLVISPMILCAIPSCIFYLLKINNFEFWKWYVVFIALHYFFNAKLKFE